MLLLELRTKEKNSKNLTTKKTIDYEKKIHQTHAQLSMLQKQPNTINHHAAYWKRRVDDKTNEF